MWNGLLDILEVLLTFFRDITGSYGVAIILLTFVLRMLMWPLTQAQLKSTRKFQDIQPRVEKLKEKYKNDQSRLNQEMVKLWRDNKVNPMAGCFPMLLQLPILIGLYQVLLRSEALNGVPFLWVTDLANPEMIILPLLAGVTTWAQSWLVMPRQQGAQQGTQQMFLWMMPALIWYITRQLAAGVGIYWVVSNLFSIGQQLITQGLPETRGRKAGG